MRILISNDDGIYSGGIRALTEGLTSEHEVYVVAPDREEIYIGAILKEQPEIVLSGINHGPNMGSDVLYSGTVSAAMEGAIYNIPSIAISLAEHKQQDFSCAVAFVSKLVKIIDQIKFPDRTLLNINIPPLPLSEI